LSSTTQQRDALISDNPFCHAFDGVYENRGELLDENGQMQIPRLAIGFFTEISKHVKKTYDMKHLPRILMVLVNMITAHEDPEDGLMKILSGTFVFNVTPVFLRSNLAHGDVVDHVVCKRLRLRGRNPEILTTVTVNSGEVYFRIEHINPAFGDISEARIVDYTLGSKNVIRRYRRRMHAFGICPRQTAA